MSLQCFWPVIKDMLFRPFFGCFLWTENLVFFGYASLSKQVAFRKGFFAKNLGEGGGKGGGGKEFWDALLLRGGLNLTCVAAWPKGPQEESQEGRGGIRLGRNMQQGNLAAYWLQSLATLAADKQEAKGRARAAALFFSSIAPCQWKRDTAGQRQ